MRAWRCAVPITVLAACGPSADADRGLPAADSAVARSAAAPDAAAITRAGPAGQGPECTELERLMRHIPGLVVDSARSTSLNQAWGGADARPACRVRAGGHWVGEYASVDSLFAWLRAAGWRENTVYQADGPDGTVYGFHRGGLTCVLAGHWDGGDDSDSTYVPSDTLEVSATCAATLPGDTALPR